MATANEQGIVNDSLTTGVLDTLNHKVTINVYNLKLKRLKLYFGEISNIFLYIKQFREGKREKKEREKKQ